MCMKKHKGFGMGLKMKTKGLKKYGYEPTDFTRMGKKHYHKKMDVY